MENNEEKFYQKKWFTIVMLIFIAPIGIPLMWINKHWNSKTRTILSVVFGIFFIIMAIISQPTEEEKAEEEALQEQAEADRKIEKEQKKKEETAVKKEEEKAEEEEKKEKEEEEEKNEIKADLKDGILTLETEETGFMFSENSLFYAVYDTFEEMHDGFKDDSVKEVEVIIKTVMTDQKGNESVSPVINYSYTKDAFEELNYDKFSTMAFGEQWRILNESDSYNIHPGIYKNLKEKYTDNLINGIAK